MGKTVTIYRTKDSIGIKPQTQFVASFENSTRKQAWNEFWENNYKNRSPYKWNFDNRSLQACHETGKRHGREKQYYAVAYMSEEELQEQIKEAQEKFVSGRGEDWETYSKRIENK